MIEDKILNALERFISQNLIPPKLLILPFGDYLELIEFTEELNKNSSPNTKQDYSQGKMYLGMIVDYEYDADKIIIKSSLKN